VYNDEERMKMFRLREKASGLFRSGIFKSIFKFDSRCFET
jgi:hypothetical protein